MCWAAVEWRSYQDEENLNRYMKEAVGVTAERPILIDRFLQHALSASGADAISEGQPRFCAGSDGAYRAGAGIHSVIRPANCPRWISLRNISKRSMNIPIRMRVRWENRADEHAVCYRAGYSVCTGGQPPLPPGRWPLVSKVCNIRMVP
jgi:carbamoyl-phosphate synthase large subunit